MIFLHIVLFALISTAHIKIFDACWIEDAKWAVIAVCFWSATQYFIIILFKLILLNLFLVFFRKKMCFVLENCWKHHIHQPIPIDTSDFMVFGFGYLFFHESFTNLTITLDRILFSQCLHINNGAIYLGYIITVLHHP